MLVRVFRSGMILFVRTHWSQIVFAALWMVSHIRKSMPAQNAPEFWRTLAYNFVKGTNAEQKPPA